MYNQGSYLNRCNGTQNNQNNTYPISNCDCPFLPLAGGTMTGTTAPIDNVFRLSGVPNSKLYLSSGTNSDIVMNSNKNININSIIGSTTITANNDINLKVINDSLTTIESRVDIQPYTTPLPYPIFDGNTVEYGLRVRKFNSTIGAGAYIGITSEDIGILSTSNYSYGYLARRINGNGSFGFRAEKIYGSGGPLQSDSTVAFYGADIRNEYDSEQSVAGVELYDILAMGDGSTSGGTGDGIRMGQMYGSTIRGVRINNAIASTNVTGIYMNDIHSNNQIIGTVLNVMTAKNFTGVQINNIASNTAFSGTNIEVITTNEFNDYTIRNITTNVFNGYKITNVTGNNSINLCVFNDITSYTGNINGINANNIVGNTEVKCISFKDIKSNISTAAGAVFDTISGFDDCNGLSILNLKSIVGTSYGVNISSVYSNNVVGINVDTIRANTNIANGMIISSVTGEYNQSNGLYLNNLSSLNGKMNGINIENIYSQNGTNGINIYNLNTFYNDQSVGILISSILCPNSYGIVLKDIIGFSGGGILIDNISLTSGIPVKAFDIINIYGAGDTLGLNINNVSSIYAKSVGVSATNVTSEFQNSYGMYISSITSLTTGDAYGIYIDGISSLNGISYGIYQANTTNSSNVFENRIKCGISEPSTSEFVSLTVDGSIRNRVQLTGATASYDILINGGNVVVSNDVLNNTILLPNPFILGAPIDGITYTIWKTHTDPVIINNNGGPNINGTPTSFTFTGGAGTAYTKMTVVYIDFTIGWLARIG
jgi:hypothetical protein